MLHLHQLFMGLAHEELDDVLLAQPVAAGHRIVEVRLQAVVRLGDSRRAAFRGHGVAAHRVNLGDERNAQRGVGLGHRDSGPKACSAGTHDCHIGLEDIHLLASSFLVG